MENELMESRIEDLIKITRKYILVYLLFISHILIWKMPAEDGAFTMRIFMFILFLIFSICIKIFCIDYIKYIKKYITKKHRGLLIIFILFIISLIIIYDIISIVLFKITDDYYRSINTIYDADKLGWFFNKLRYGNYYYSAAGVPIIYLVIKIFLLDKKLNKMKEVK